MILPEAVRNLQLPKMVKVEQVFADEHLEDTVAAVKAQAAPFAAQMREGASAAVLVGSRGVTDINLIAKAVVDTLRDAGVKPFIIPAMGSHGGGTSEGQEEILRGYGITAETMGVPINSSMETEIIGETEAGMEVHFSKPALEADYVVPIGRVKPHTDFTGVVESGLCKMLAIGGGKHNGCSRIHREGFPALEHTIPDSARVIRGRVDIPFGLAVIENAFEKTHTVEAVRGRDFLTRARGLLLRVAADTEGFTLTHEGRSMALRCTEAPQFSTDAAFAAGDAAFFTLRAEGRDGICFSGPSVSAAGRGVLGGVRFPHAITEETVFASMVRDGEMSVYNGGDCPCGFVAAVTAEGGGLDAFSLRLDGDVITVSHPLAEGESVVIDTRPGQKSVTADGASILEQTDWQSVFFSLQPGENRIGWSAVGGGRAAVRLTFTPLYL